MGPLFLYPLLTKTGGAEVSRKKLPSWYSEKRVKSLFRGLNISFRKYLLGEEGDSLLCCDVSCPENLNKQVQKEIKKFLLKNRQTINNLFVGMGEVKEPFLSVGYGQIRCLSIPISVICSLLKKFKSLKVFEIPPRQCSH